MSDFTSDAGPAPCESILTSPRAFLRVWSRIHAIEDDLVRYRASRGGLDLPENRAPGRRRSDALCCVSSKQPPAMLSSTMRTCFSSTRGRCAISAVRRRDHIPGSYVSINPTMTVADVVAEPLRVQSLAKGIELARKPCRAALRVTYRYRPFHAPPARRSAPAGSASALSSPALSRSNLASSWRMNAGFGTRRLDPGTDIIRLLEDLKEQRGAYRAVHVP